MTCTVWNIVFFFLLIVWNFVVYMECYTHIIFVFKLFLWHLKAETCNRSFACWSNPFRFLFYHGFLISSFFLHLCSCPSTYLVNTCYLHFVMLQVSFRSKLQFSLHFQHLEIEYHNFTPCTVTKLAYKNKKSMQNLFLVQLKFCFHLLLILPS